MKTVTVTEKSSGDNFTHEDYNDIVDAVNSNAADKYKSIFIRADSMLKDPSYMPADTNYFGYRFVCFAATEKAYFSTILPEDYKEGTDLKPYIVLINPSTFAEQSYDLDFDLKVSIQNVTDTIVTAVRHVSEVNYTDGTEKTTIRRFFSTDVSGTGIEIGAVLVASLECTANEIPADVPVVGVGFVYESDARGESSYNDK